jgi:uncharacterized protein DUF6268
MLLDQTKKILASSLGLMSLTGAALAADPTSGYSGLETMEAKRVEQKFQINPGFTYLADADFDHKSRDGKVSVWRFDIPGRYTVSMPQGELRLGAFYEYSSYDFSKLNDDQQFNTLAFDALWKGMFNDNWGYFVYGGVTLSADKDAALSDGLTGVGGGGARYVWSENLSLGLGLAVASRLEDDAFVVPIIALEWQINDRWHLRTLNGATVTYDVTGEKKFFMDLGGRFQRREYRTDHGDASLTEKMISVELGAIYHFSPKAAIRGFVGVAAGRNFEIRADDHKVADEDVDTAPYFGVRALFTF